MSDIPTPPPPRKEDAPQSSHGFSLEKNPSDSSPPKTIKNPIGKKTFKLSREEKERYIKALKKTPLWILLLKYVALCVFLGSTVGWFWLKADLNPENKYLSIYGVDKNIAQKYTTLKKKKSDLEQETGQLAFEIERIKKQLENQEYSQYSRTIQTLKNEQLTFFDTKDHITPLIETLQYTAPHQREKLFESAYITPSKQEELLTIIADKEKRFQEIQDIKQEKGREYDRLTQQEIERENAITREEWHDLLLHAGLTEKEFGVLEMPFHMRDFLASDAFEDLLLTNDNSLVIENVSVNREVLTFNISGYNVFGNTFLLHTQFIEHMNAVPFLENGLLTTFEKEIDEEGNPTMTYTARFDIVRAVEDDNEAPITETDQTTENTNEEEEKEKAEKETKPLSETRFDTFKIWEEERNKK